MPQPTVIIIAGPTAVGKTAFAISVAKHLQTEIISADSRQCYKEMRTGVARPSDDELAQVTHHFIASHSVTDDLNAGSFEKYALGAAERIFREHSTAVMVGGTGLYIKSFCEGIDPMPLIPDEVRQDIIRSYEQKGLIWLQKELQHKDPVFWEAAEQQNPHRLMRALEVFNATGHSIMEYRTSKKADRPFRVIKIALELPKEELRDRINRRVDQMMDDGLLEEARSLLPFRSYNALQTVGYKELFDHFDGLTSLDEAVASIKKNTRQYAKRQMTWFKKDKEYQWTAPSPENIAAMLMKI